ncbi:MAG: RIP metalloprotease RseP, partial [Candidatus Kapaibacterium sp.]
MAIIQYIFPFVVLIIILVFVHELGHFLAAKLCGVRASVFAVGMGPRVFGWNKITGFTFGKIAEDLDLGNHTDYRLSALPFGGYVKIEGMIDESMDEDFTNKPPQQWEFRTKNYFQKIFIMSAGVIMNLILAISIYTVLNMYNGRILSNTNQVGFLPESGSAYVHGLRSNDKIISINGNPIKYFEEINEEIYLKNNDKDISIKVDRNGTISDIIIPKSEVILSTKNSNILIPYSSNTFLTIESPVDGSPAEKAGIKPGDIINKIDAIDIYNSQQFRDYLDKTNGKDVNITLTRDSKLINLKVTPNLDNKIGVSISDKYHGETTTLNYKFTEAFGAGIHQIGII